MKKLFIIGGMGAGKSTARKALVEQGLPNIDLDQVGHDVLLWDTVKSELVETFGEDILGADGEIDRRALAAKAFVSPAETRKLNRITLPRIEEAFTDRVAELEAEGHKAVVVEHSVFKNRQTSLAYDADVVIAVLAPIDLRIERAVKSGWDETDVRRRIAQQITDADRIEASDVVFNNDGTPEEMRNKVLAWWGEYSKDLPWVLAFNLRGRVVGGGLPLRQSCSREQPAGLFSSCGTHQTPRPRPVPGKAAGFGSWPGACFGVKGVVILSGGAKRESKDPVQRRRWPLPQSRTCCIPRLTAAPAPSRGPAGMGLPPDFTRCTISVFRPMAAIAHDDEELRQRFERLEHGRVDAGGHCYRGDDGRPGTAG